MADAAKDEPTAGAKAAAEEPPAPAPDEEASAPAPAAAAAVADDAAPASRKRRAEGGDDAGDGAAEEPPAEKAPKRPKYDDPDKGVGWPGRRPRATRHMHGWFLPTHERVFDQVLSDKVTTILELGSWYGASTEWLARKCPKAHVFAVDLWEDAFILDAQRDHYSTMGESKLERMLRAHPLYDTFLANLWSLRDQVTPMRMQTVEGVAYLKEKGIVPEVIYIDADHHYAGCKADIEACLKAFPDAVLCGDDYGHYDDVRNAVTECAAAFDKTVHVDQNHCWTYAPLNSVTGRTFKPRPKADASFAALLGGYAK